jgi:hypothetical protein
MDTESWIIADRTTIKRDAGVITENPINYDFHIGKSVSKEIASINVSCACTSLSIQKGNILDCDKPFHVSINLDEKQWGKGSQSFVIKFTDDTFIQGQLTYNYLPEPYAIPPKLSFFEDISEIEVVFYFPAEDNVKFDKINTPSGIICIHKEKKLQKNEARLIFILDRNAFHDVPSGIISIYYILQSEIYFFISLPCSIVTIQ